MPRKCLLEFSEFSTVIRFSSSTKDPGKKLKKTITQTRLVDGKRIVTKKTEDDGEETVEVTENGVSGRERLSWRIGTFGHFQVLKSRLINGCPVRVSAA